MTLRYGTRDWNFKAKQTSPNRWLAWAARVDDLGEGPMDIKALPPHVTVHFEFGDSEEDALDKLKNSLAN